MNNHTTKHSADTFRIGDLVGEYKPWRHALDVPFYQVTDIKDGKFVLRRIDAKPTCPVYVTPVKNAFLEQKDGFGPLEITAVLYRKKNVLAYRKKNMNPRLERKYGPFIHLNRVYEGGEYGFDD